MHLRKHLRKKFGPHRVAILRCISRGGTDRPVQSVVIFLWHHETVISDFFASELLAGAYGFCFPGRVAMPHDAIEGFVR